MVKNRVTALAVNGVLKNKNITLIIGEDSTQCKVLANNKPVRCTAFYIKAVAGQKTKITLELPKW